MTAGDTVTREQALVIARDAATTAQPGIDAFDVDVDDQGAYWMVRFTDPMAMADGASQHLEVRVEKRTGKARIFHGR
jgi:hypothetical protein